MLNHRTSNAMPLSALNLDTAKTTLSPATRIVTLPGPFTLHRGGVLPKVEIAYETWGELNADKGNVVLLFTGLSPSAHEASSPDDAAAGRWEEMIGPRKPIDTDRFHVICINSLGSCFGSTGPASINPETMFLRLLVGGLDVTKTLGEIIAVALVAPVTFAINRSWSFA